MPLGEEIILKRGHQRGYPLRNRYFTVINSSSVRTVADWLLIMTSTTGELSAGTSIYMTLKDLEPQNRVVSEFFAISDFDTHFKGELRRNH